LDGITSCRSKGGRKYADGKDGCKKETTEICVEFYACTSKDTKAGTRGIKVRSVMIVT
jgi:hypothetical protein